ncbi:MAG: bifunctional UDP-N-acetylglucosamine diphosphorylase/glucosamine-1-phosphate N-acetyltransferase GlmU, partial [Alphaproteobacteria bacterium]|nr:bifunctional UDP-N-acetylglucosamine diphosphorylase/glucosamine-1-phosphate N-acetyltransferase GlmU [Alphaproteobacteria bacterium]
IESLRSHSNASCMVFCFMMEESNQYGKLLVADEYVVDIVEYFEDKDSQIPHCNSGIIIVESKYLKEALGKISNNNNKNEYYLTDVVKVLESMKRKSLYYVGTKEEFLGVNSQEERDIADKVLQKRIVNQLFTKGVTIYNPETSYFDYNIYIESGVEIEPNVQIKKGARIENGALIRSFSYLEDCKIGKNAIVGPYARVRPKTVLHENVHLGSFVEAKNAEINENSKANHLAYLGDIKIGRNVNIGAGTIVCNYDGFNKYNSEIGDNVFVGSNSCIISPINIGEGSIIGAGSVVAKTVESDSLVIARAEEKHLKNKAKSFRQIKKAKSAK